MKMLRIGVDEQELAGRGVALNPETRQTQLKLTLFVGIQTLLMLNRSNEGTLRRTLRRLGSVSRSHGES
jgi:hypothetical protein